MVKLSDWIMKNAELLKMAPGARKLKPKSIPNNSQQCSVNQTTKDVISNSTPRRSIRRLFDKVNVASAGANEALVTTGTNDSSIERGETTDTNPTNESHTIPQNPEVQDPSLEANDITGFKLKKKRTWSNNGQGHYEGICFFWKKIKVTVDPLLGRPKTREESAKLSSQIGVVTRDILPVPKTSFDSTTQQLQKELQETQEKLQDSESQVSGLKAQVSDLKEQLGLQGASIDKLMAFMTASGNNI